MSDVRRSTVVSLLIAAGFAAWLQHDGRQSTRAAEVPAAPSPELLFPTPYNSEHDKTGPMPATEAAAQMKLPAGFNANVFASEPDVQNPIAMAWDGRGRLWIAENYTYAESPKKLEMNLRDRILIFEDKNNIGHFSSRKVFTDKLKVLTSLEIGRGGVWALCPPQLLFIPSKEGSDAPDGPPQVVLDGFTVPPQNHHNFANGLKFGPDGWLYGRCGHSAPGEIGAPGTPSDARIPIHGTMWRYHQQRKIFESLASGTTNPWGHDWDEHGELFFINTVNGHLWHQITGAHYLVTGGNAHTYALIDQHADHWHFDTAQSWTKSRNGGGDSFGGGHAHIGAMIYQADNWPAEYRGHLFTFNMHGYRANQEILERTGSGYVGHHGEDVLFTADKWFRGIDLGYGPDGGVFAIDWSDTGECHESTGVHRTSGRIFKISYGQPASPSVSDLLALDQQELVKLHRHTNEWFVRQARRILTDRSANGEELTQAKQQLRELFDNDPAIVNKLRAMWTLYAIGAADERFLLAQLDNDNEHVLVWAIRLLTDRWPLDTTESKRPANAVEANSSVLMPRLLNLAANDKSGLVRLVLASTLQRLPIEQRVALAKPLVAHQEDAQDHNLPLMIWYGLVPLALERRWILGCQRVPRTHRQPDAGDLLRVGGNHRRCGTYVDAHCECADMTQPFIIDAHLDLAMNAIEWNRDLTLAVKDIRAAEQDQSDKPGRGRNTVSLPELRRGRVGLVVATQIARVWQDGAYSPVPGWKSPATAWAMTQAQLAWYRAMEEAGEMTPICSVSELDAHVARWLSAAADTDALPIGYLLSLEGADSILTPAHLERVYEQGLRAIGPAHYGPGRYAMGTDTTGGFPPAWRELLKEINRLGMILDVTHLSDDCFNEALDTFDGPIWASHHNCRALVPHQRQLTDEQIARLVERDAVIGAALDAWVIVPNWARGQTTPESVGLTLEHLVEHIDHICQIAGNAKHIGLGFDLDGAFGTEQTPGDLDTIADVQRLPVILRDRGYSPGDASDFASGNFLRFLRRSLPG